MKKTIIGLLFTGIILGACSVGNSTDKGYDPFGSSAYEDKRKSESEAAELSKVMENRKSTPNSYANHSESSSETTSSIYENSESSSQPDITSASKEQKDSLIAWTQMDCEDRSVKLKYSGKDKWNIAVNPIDDTYAWIVTTDDRNQGRIKAIYHWDGERDSGAELVYLLVSGTELVNTM
ncbi:hypothetical protein A5800_001677 [Enterococcus sp. 5B7_DIV0075]|uniref:hypothetical protein n=1 Tax=Enterococcus sp. 5B7_DIV0075 TaxID=1987386 RepID=UPI000A333155|nr:hypothetical protein [Enterococcus sp. 5B7_DIV0075]OTP23820.1 hypothetical protein A5800_001677 [Enterococcus sp. 5B7_DIV0075]